MNTTVTKAKRTRRKSEITRDRLLKAAAKVIAKVGYEKASISRIAEEAGIASGGFYYYFASRRDLFDELLPTLGQQMVTFVSDQIRGLPWGVEREVAAFKAFLQFLRQNPEFYIVFSEARAYARDTYASNFFMTIQNYRFSLFIQKSKGFISLEDNEVEILTHFLSGIRNSITLFYMNGEYRLEGDRGEEAIERAVVVYRKLLLEGVFRE